MAIIERLAVLREEFELSANPIAYLPYAAALRQERLYAQALEVCQRGLTRTPGSVAGRTLLGRLYCDIGSYAESRAILDEVYREVPGASGVRVALARTLLRLLEIDRAADLIEILARENPEDPEVQMLKVTLRYVRSRSRRTPPEARGPALGLPVPGSGRECLEFLVHQIGELSPVIGAALVSLTGAFEPVGIGEHEQLRDAAEALVEIRKACRELEVGETLNGQFDLSGATILSACRNDSLVLLCLEPSDRLGRIKAVLGQLLSHLFPPAESTDIVARELKA